MLATMLLVVGLLAVVISTTLCARIFAKILKPLNAFTLLRAEKDDDFIILEMGMSDFGEIDLLGKISSPDISVITNIGESHLEFLKTKKNVFKAKTEIVPHTRETLVINGDDEYLKILMKVI